MAICEKCKQYEKEIQGCIYMDADCKNGEMFEQITNYERIKSMSLEELAEFLEKNGSDEFHEMTDSNQCRECERRLKLVCNAEDCPYMDTYGVKQWLESEVEL